MAKTTETSNIGLALIIKLTMLGSVSEPIIKIVEIPQFINILVYTNIFLP